MTEYEESKELNATIEKMVANTKLHELDPIREHGPTLFGLMSVRMNSNDEEEQGPGYPVICRKISPPFQKLTGGHYLVIADNYFWNHTDEKAREGALYHALMFIEITENDKGVVKYGTRKPTVQAWPSELVHFGPHSSSLMDMREAMIHSANRFAESMKTAA